MAKLRIGFSSDFTLDSSEVGIGTTNPTSKLQVVDTLKGDFNITGVSTLRVYGGFAAQKQNVTKDSSIGFSTTGIGTVGITSFISVNERETGFLSLVGEYNTVSEDLIVDEGKIFEISTTNITGITTLGTQEVYAPDDSVVSVGTLESVSIQSHFSVPDGGSNDRPDQPTEGMVRFNDDLNTLEFYNGIEWRQFTVSGASGRAVLGGGYSTTTQKTMSYINISSEGNAINFGDLVTQRFRVGACSSSTRGLFGGGINPSTVSTIDYITIASEGNAIQFGSLSAGRATANSSCSSSTRGLWAGGYNPSSNVIDYVEINTLGTAQDFGDLRNLGDGANGEKNQLMSCSSPTRGVWAGGSPIAAGTILLSGIDFVTISSKGNAINGGELTQDAFQSSAFSNSVRGIFGENRISANTITTNVLSFVTLSSLGNAQDFGDLTIARFTAGSASSQIRGVIAGGYTGAILNTIDFVTISTTGNAQDFGDLTKTTYVLDGCSDSHGGLGGF